MELRNELIELQRLLGEVDLLTRSRRPTIPGLDELLLVKLDNLTLRMHKEQAHKRPHLHIDYGRERHVASYGIDPPERLAGNLDGKYDRTVRNWISPRREGLRNIWNALQRDGDTSDLVLKLDVSNRGPEPI